MKNSNDVSDYDLFDYDYSTYWRNREYESMAEKYLLDNIFDRKKGIWFLDIGGSYGRLAATYCSQYSNPIILDYSLKTLQKNKDFIKAKFPDIELIAGNVYKMPFRDNVFDGAMMVRVLHHIENTDDCFCEVNRVMDNNSVYIQEFANKMHLKAVIRALLHFNFKFFNKTPYEHPLSNSKAEGTSDGLKGIFYNFHPAYVKESLRRHGFEVKKEYGCSFLRIPILKKLLNEDIILFFEKIFQKILSWTNIAPSLFYVSTTKKDTNEKFNEDIKEILVCPECKGELIFETSESCICKKCKKKYKKEDDIWDFRVL